MQQIILFDGDCHFCNRSVHFIIKRDPQGRFAFASLQSEAGKALLAKHTNTPTDSFVFIDNDKMHTKSTAALHVAKQLTGIWQLTYGFIIIPRGIRDFFYTIIAKHRYKWFGKNDQCIIPSPEIQKRFID